MIKKISAFLLAMALAFGCLASCGKTKDDSSSKAKTESKAESSAAATDSTAETVADASLTIDGKKVDTKDLIMLTVDGHDVSFDEYRYFYYQTLSNLNSSYGFTADSLKQDESVFSAFLEQVEQSIKIFYLADKLAELNNITLTKDDLNVVDKNLKSAQSQYQSEEEYLQSLKESYMTESVLKTYFQNQQLAQKVNSALFATGGKYATPVDEFKKIVQDTKEYSRVIHILIPYECKAVITDKEDLETYNGTDDLSTRIKLKRTVFNQQTEDVQAKLKAQAKTLADAVLKKAMSGEDFEALVKKYGWDPGMVTNPDGYYINQNTSFVQEFKDAAFALKENEISDLVENTSYGWFIIKRLPVDMDYVNENIDSLISDYDTPRINEFCQKYIAKMKIEGGKYYDKLTADSIQ